jgi:hypothetical protein
VGGHQLKQQGTPQVYQHGVGDLLPVVVPRYGYRGWPTIGCVLMDSLGAKAVRQPGLLLGWCGTYVLGKFSR